MSMRSRHGRSRHPPNRRLPSQWNRPNRPAKLCFASLRLRVPLFGLDPLRPFKPTARPLYSHDAHGPFDVGIPPVDPAVTKDLRIRSTQGGNLGGDTIVDEGVGERWEGRMRGAGSSTPVFPDGVMGTDEFGVFGDFDVCGVVQRFRWCPPGVFWMGSPEEEAGRYSWEGPRHRLRLTRGCWMADTPVTQSFYLAVIGDNPSEFADVEHPDRPVERVSWEDAQTFCASLDAFLGARVGKSVGTSGGEGTRVSGVADGLAGKPWVFRLPTEAEWEYACRAGTRTAIYTGALTLRGENDAPELDAIAWYGGNSGVVYSLMGGVDASRWPQKQFQHSLAGTRRVKQKQANPWGLYDMLGNVGEWCLDAVPFGQRYPVALVEGQETAARRDPVGGGAGEAIATRAFRGGAWDAQARDVRAAYRYAVIPAYRNGNLGFRLCCGPPLGAQWPLARVLG